MRSARPLQTVRAAANPQRMTTLPSTHGPHVAREGGVREMLMWARHPARRAGGRRRAVCAGGASRKIYDYFYRAYNEQQVAPAPDRNPTRPGYTLDREADRVHARRILIRAIWGVHSRADTHALPREIGTTDTQREPETRRKVQRRAPTYSPPPLTASPRSSRSGGAWALGVLLWGQRPMPRPHRAHGSTDAEV